MRKFWESIYYPNYISGYNPFLLKDMNKAIERVSQAVNSREKIVIYGIDTVDGICSISSLSLVLRYLNADVEYVIQGAEKDSKGLGINEIRERVHFLGAKLLITLGVDLESEAVVKETADLGIDLIVLENRKTVKDRNYIYVNPSQKACQYRYKNLSTSVLTFKLMQAIAIYYNMKSINKYLDLILLGGQWTGNSLKGENGVVLKEARKFLSNTNNYGLKAIMKNLNIIELKDENIKDIIDYITPTQGSVGTVGNARIIIELLTTGDKDRTKQITKYLLNSKK